MVRVWDAVTGRQLAIGRGHPEPITQLAFNSDNTRLAVIGAKTATVWALTGGQEALTLGFNLTGVNVLAFNPDGSQLALSTGAHRGVQVWDVVTGEGVGTFPSP
jgi:WD40 repeat protein